MTIEQAIRNYSDSEKLNKRALKYRRSGQPVLAELCKKTARDHEQLAAWLKELKQRRKADKQGGETI